VLVDRSSYLFFYSSIGVQGLFRGGYGDCRGLLECWRFQYLEEYTHIDSI